MIDEVCDDNHCSSIAGDRAICLVLDKLVDLNGRMDASAEYRGALDEEADRRASEPPEVDDTPTKTCNDGHELYPDETECGECEQIRMDDEADADFADRDSWEW
jgi:hypothetical protein